MYQVNRGVLQINAHDNQLKGTVRMVMARNVTRGCNSLCVLRRAQLHPPLRAEVLSRQQTAGTAVHGGDPWLQQSQAAKQRPHWDTVHSGKPGIADNAVTYKNKCGH
jgi:hypothetical protein